MAPRIDLNLTIVSVSIFALGLCNAARLYRDSTAVSQVALQDLITSLPGQPKVDFDQYSGYITVDESTGKNLFYWLTEAVEPDDKPLVLWLNGGPGCSSIGGGLMTENGPWRVKDQTSTTLELNPYAWNQEANMLFLESPAGVGFSYSETSSDLTTNDEETAIGNYLFLQGFLERHSRYQNRSFFITGESYAGHYIPQLAKKILDGNKLNDTIQIPLIGFAAGNPLTEITEDILYGPLLSFYNHALISDYTWDTIKQNCIFEWDYYTFFGIAGNVTCDNALMDAYTEIGNVDPYDIYADSCTYTISESKSLEKTNLYKYIPALDMARKARIQTLTKLTNSVATGSTYKGDAFQLSNPACLDVWTATYLNRPDVKRAIHAKTDLPVPWTDCSDILSYDYKYSLPQSIVPLYKDFIANNPELRIWVYSGDCDTVVPFVGSRRWIRTLRMNVTSIYRAWYDADQVGGYTETYSGLTFATVRGAGHLVPLGQPSRALNLFVHFLKGDDLPSLPPPQ